MRAALAQRPTLAGNGLAAVYALDLLLQQWDADSILVVAPPDEAKHGWQVSLADAARDRGVRVTQPQAVNDQEVVDEVWRARTDLLLSVYYTQIFHPQLLDVIAGPALNFHPSLLPRHRGTAPLVWAIVEGDATTGVSVHRLTSGIDTGPLVDQAALPIHPDDTGYTLHEKAALLVRALAARLLRRLCSGEGLPAGREQAGRASYHSKRDPTVNHVDWSESRERVRNVVRALAPPLPGAYTTIADRQVLLEAVSNAEASGPARPPGMIEFRKPDHRALVWAADGALAIDRCRVGDEAVDGSIDGIDLLLRFGVLDGDIAR